MAVLKKCIGIDLGTSSIKVAELVMESGAVLVNKMVSTDIAIPESAPRTERQKAMVNALKGLLKSSKISTKEAVFCVPGQTVFIRRFPLPNVSEERLERIIKYEARQKIPYPLEKTMIEYQIFRKDSDSEVDVFLVALKKDVLFDFMDLVTRTGLRPVGISVSTLALYNYHTLDSMSREVFETRFGKKKRKLPKFRLPQIPKIKKKSKKAKVKEEEKPEPEMEEEGMEESFLQETVRGYIHISDNMTDLSIGSMGEHPTLGFTRSIPIAGQAITQAIMDNCENVRDLQQADQVKHEKAVVLSMDADLEGKDTQASEAMTGVVDRIIAELRRSLDFYISQPDGMAVDEIILTGSESHIPHIGEYIEDKLGIPVFKYESPGEVFKGLKSDERSLTTFPICIGLGLLGLGLGYLKIDFLPPERKVAIKFKRKRGFVLVLAAMVAGTIILGAMSGDHYITIYQDQTARYQDEFRRNLPVINRIKEATKTQDELSGNFEKLAKGLTNERDYPLRRWLDILKSKPPDVLISSLMIFPNGKIQIEGFVEDMSSAVTFTSNLNSELLEKNNMLEGKGARLSNIKTEYNDLFEKDVNKFTINMKIKGRYSRVTPEVPATSAEPTPRARRRPVYGRGMPGGAMMPEEMM